MDKNELKDRTKSFALRVMTLVDHLPTTTKGRVIADQITRSATSVAANYRALAEGDRAPSSSPNSALFWKK
jgi:four helix bundle protein